MGRRFFETKKCRCRTGAGRCSENYLIRIDELTESLVNRYRQADRKSIFSKDTTEQNSGELTKSNGSTEAHAAFKSKFC